MIQTHHFSKDGDSDDNTAKADTVERVRAAPKVGGVMAEWIAPAGADNEDNLPFRGERWQHEST
jgi:hypothetical protein